MKRTVLIIFALTVTALVFWLFFNNWKTQSALELPSPGTSALQNKSSRPSGQQVVLKHSSSGRTNENFSTEPVNSVRQRSADSISERKIERTALKSSKKSVPVTEEIVSASPLKENIYEQQTTVEEMFAQLHDAESQQNHDLAMEILLSMKDVTQGEDLQSVLKRLHDYAEYGANEDILDVFLFSQAVAEVERFRVLTYINPEYLLEADSVEKLNSEYDQIRDDDLQNLIINTVAESGGDTGAELLVDRAENTTVYSEWKLLVNALGKSQSENAFVYLNTLLDDMTLENPRYPEDMTIVRQAIDSIRQ